MKKQWKKENCSKRKEVDVHTQRPRNRFHSLTLTYIFNKVCETRDLELVQRDALPVVDTLQCKETKLPVDIFDNNGRARKFVRFYSKIKEREEVMNLLS